MGPIACLCAFGAAVLSAGLIACSPADDGTVKSNRGSGSVETTHSHKGGKSRSLGKGRSDTAVLVEATNGGLDGSTDGNAAGGADGGSGATGGSGGAAGGSDDPHGTPGTIQPSGGKLHVMPIGDSITIGVAGGYRNDIYEGLTARGFDVDMVGTQNDEWTVVEDKDHESYSGATFLNSDYYLEEWLSAITTPDVVLVMLGTNDLAWWTAVGPEGTRDQMVVFVDHLRKELPEAVLILATIPPQTPGNVEIINLDRAEMTKEFNSLLKAELQERPDHGSRVFVADVNAVLTLDDLYDGFHPTREAHTEIANVFLDVMHDLLPVAP